MIFSLISLNGDLFQTHLAEATSYSGSDNFANTTKIDLVNSTGLVDVGENAAKTGQGTLNQWAQMSEDFNYFTPQLYKKAYFSPVNDTFFIILEPRGGLFRTTDGGTTFAFKSPVTEEVIQDVAISPNYATDDTIFVATASSGLWKSTNEGDTWTNIQATIGGESDIESVAVSPTYNNASACGVGSEHQCTVFVGLDTLGLYRSVDKGTSFVNADGNGSLPNDGGEYTLVSPNYSTDFTVYVATLTNGVYKSTNCDAASAPGAGNCTWAATGAVTNNAGFFMAFSPNYSTDNTLFYLNNSNWTLDKSTNNGTSWTAIAAASTYGSGDALAFAVSPTYNQSEADCGANPDNCTIVIVSIGGDGVVKSTDKGTTFPTIATGFASECPVAGVYFSDDYASDDTIFSGTLGCGIYKSTNNGSSFSRDTTVTGISGQVTDIAVSPDFVDDLTIFATSFGGGLMKSTNGGASWSNVWNGTSTPGVFSVEISPNFETDETIFYGTKGTDFTGDRGIFKSTNGGSTWTKKNTGANGLAAALNVHGILFSNTYNEDESNCVTNPDNCTLFAITEDKAYKSVDRGDNWTLSKDFSADGDIAGFDISPDYAAEAAGGTLYAFIYDGGANDSTIFNSTNGGTTWNDLGTVTGRFYFGVKFAPTYDQDTVDATGCAGTPEDCTIYWWQSVAGGTFDVMKTEDESMTPITAYDSSAEDAPGIQSSDLAFEDFTQPIAFSADFADDDTLYTAIPLKVSSSRDNVLKTEDNGTTWTSADVAGLADNYRKASNTIVFSPNFENDNTAFVGNAEVWRNFSYSLSPTIIQSGDDDFSDTVENINCATLTATATTPTNTSITYEMSNDGSTFSSVTSGVKFCFTTQGKELKWRANVDTNDAEITPRLTNVSISFGNTVPSAPTLSSPANGVAGASVNPTLEMSATDADTSDILFYEVDIATDSSFTNPVANFNQTKRFKLFGGEGVTGVWSDIDGYSSGGTASVQVPTAKTLSPLTTYYWRARAIDHNGGLSAYSSTRSFTTGEAGTRTAKDLFDTKILRDLANSTAQWSTPYASVLKLNATNTFGAATAILGANSTNNMIAGDFDADSDIDVIVGESGADSRLYTNNGSGVFSAAHNFGTSTTYGLAPVDIDNDGDLDVIIGNNDAQSQMCLNNGSGVFTCSSRFGSTCQVKEDGVATADFDKDGWKDVVVGCFETDGSVEDTIFFHNSDTPTPTFTSFNTRFSATKDTQASEAGDFDGDGDADIVLGYASSNAILFTNDGKGTFTQGSLSGTSGVFRITSDDADRDGDLDLLFTFTTGDSKLLLNDGSASFTSYTISTTDACAGALADVDGDGDADMVYGAGSGPCSNASSQNKIARTKDFSAASQIDDETPGTFGTNDTTTVLAFDADGDGDVDVIEGNYGQNYWYANTSAQSFASETPSAFDTSVAYTRLIPFDADNDGDEDLLSSSPAGAQKLYCNDGTGTYTAYAALPAGRIPVMKPEDMSGDNYADLIVWDGTDTLYYYANVGTGVCSAATFPTANSTIFDTNGGGTFASLGFIRSADIDADGDFDLVVPTQAVSANYIVENTGTGVGDFEVTSAFGTFNAEHIVPADVDNDGDLDMLLANRVAGGGQNYLYRNNGSGTFTQVAAFGVATNVTNIMTPGDLDGDGFTDVVIINEDAAGNFIAWNRGDGTFDLQSYFGTAFYEVDLTDVDGDGDIDVLANDRTTPATASQYIFYNQGNRSFARDTSATGLGYIRNIVATDVDRDGDKDVVFADNDPVTRAHLLYRQEQNYTGVGTQTIQSTAVDNVSQNIVSVTFSAVHFVPGASTITYYVSNDGGTTFEPVAGITAAQAAVGYAHTFASSGSDLRWKAQLTPGSTPLIYDTTLVYGIPGGGGGGTVCSLSCLGKDSATTASVSWKYSYPACSGQAAYTGFKLFKEEGQDRVLVATNSGVEAQNRIPFEETGFTPNEQVRFRSVHSYVTSGGVDTISNPADCPIVYTLAEKPIVEVTEVEDLTATAHVTNATNVDAGQSGVRWEVERCETENTTCTVVIRYSTDFLPSAENSPKALSPDTWFRIRAQARNGEAVETEWSEWVSFKTKPFIAKFLFEKTAMVEGVSLGISTGQEGNILGNIGSLFEPRVRQSEAMRYLVDFSSIATAFLVFALGILLYHFVVWQKTRLEHVQITYKNKAAGTFLAVLAIGLVKVALFASMATVGSFDVAAEPVFAEAQNMEPGDTITYAIYFENQTLFPLKSSVNITDDVPAVLQLDPQLSIQGIGETIPTATLSGNKLTIFADGFFGHGSGGRVLVKGSLPFPYTGPVLELTNKAVANRQLLSDATPLDQESNTVTTQVKVASLTATVFRDANNNAVKESQETGISGIRTSLFYDTNGNSNFDNGIDRLLYSNQPTTTNGTVTFGGLRSGTYFVEVLTPAGYTLTSASGRQTVVIADKGGVGSVGFGFAPPQTEVAPVITVPTSGQSFLPGQIITASGNSRRGALPVQVLLDGSLSSTVNAGIDGAWSAPLGSLALGTHTLQARTASALQAGTYLNSSSITFSVTKEAICQPMPEMCDNVDNDCDGEVDESGVCGIMIEINGTGGNDGRGLEVEVRGLEVAGMSISQLQSTLVGLTKEGRNDIRSGAKTRAAFRVSGTFEPNKRYELVVKSDPQILPFTPPTAQYVFETTAVLDPGEHEAYVQTTNNQNELVIVSNVVSFSVALPACFDGSDNDSDGKTDFPDDAGCLSVLDNDEFDEVIPEDFELFFGEVVGIAQTIVDQTTEVFNDPRVERATNRYVAPALIIVAVANTTTAISLLSLIPFLQFIFTEPLRMLSRRKRYGWGIVYNSLTKRPVDLAIVRLLDKATGAQIQTQVTDKAGRYSFLVKKPGLYRLEVVKPEYEYPTLLLLTKKEDADFVDLYHGEDIQVSEEGAVITANIPIDPEVRDVANKRVIAANTARRIQNIVSTVGIGLSGLTVLIAPQLIIILLFLLHISLFLLFRRLSYPPRPKSWGILYDKKDRHAVSAGVVRIFDTQFNKLLGTQVTDAKGRYGFLVGGNAYYLTADKQGYFPAKTDVLDLAKEQTAAITKDIALQKIDESAKESMVPYTPAKSQRMPEPKPPTSVPTPALVKPEVPLTPTTPVAPTQPAHEEHYTDTSQLKPGQFPEGKGS